MKKTDKGANAVIIDKTLAPFTVAVSLKEAGDMGLSSESNSDARNALLGMLGLSENRAFRNNQVHSSVIVEPIEMTLQDADGLISSNHSDKLMLLTADCYNVFFTTEGGRKFGAIHAGWKGIAGGIITNARKLLSGESKVLIAQGICTEHFTVKREVADLFVNKFGEDYLTFDFEAHVNLRKIINDLLKDQAEVYDLNLCNVCRRDILFSYREGNVKERNLSIIWRDNV
ncbi:MAG: polyphenol oxidase family protein [bacterium]|nr:polyphenol oxidase family protein [bacterium]